MALFNLNRRRTRSRAATSAPASLTSPTTTTSTANAAVATPAPRRYPEAIPCYNYYDIYPEDAGPMGHIVIDDDSDMRVWRLTATPIAPEAALKKGGCIQFLSGSRTDDGPAYYEFAHKAEEVYGSAAYEKVIPGSPNGCDYVVTKSFPASKQVDVNTSYGGLSDEGLTDAKTLAG